VSLSITSLLVTATEYTRCASCQIIFSGLCVPGMGTLQTGFKSPVEIPEHENEETMCILSSPPSCSTRATSSCAFPQSPISSSTAPRWPHLPFMSPQAHPPDPPTRASATTAALGTCARMARHDHPTFTPAPLMDLISPPIHHHPAPARHPHGLCTSGAKTMATAQTVHPSSIASRCTQPAGSES
jgi:hypothetical protein